MKIACNHYPQIITNSIMVYFYNTHINMLYIFFGNFFSTCYNL